MNKLIVGYDQYAESPREWAEYSKVFSQHRGLRGDFQYQGIYDSLEEEFDKRIGFKNVVAVPVYLYEHSGIVLDTKPFSCPFDSGQLGYIYYPKDVIRKVYGWERLSQKRIAELEKYLKGEVEEWSQYVSGEVYWFRVEDEEGEVLDSCGGIYDIEDYLDEVKSYFPEDQFEKIKEKALSKL